MIGTFVIWALLALEPNPDPQALLHAGDDAASAGRWDEAADAYGRAFDATGNLRVGFGYAEALRFGGRCDEALPIYEMCTAPEAPKDIQALAADRKSLCEQALTPEPEPPPPPVETTDTLPPRAPQRPWYRDPAGDALVATGLATAVAGGIVLGLGVSEGNAGGAQTDAELGQAIDRAQTRALAGGITLGVGSALLLGGVVRWVIVDRRNRDLDVALSHRGLVVSGRLPTLADLLR